MPNSNHKIRRNAKIALEAIQKLHRATDMPLVDWQREDGWDESHQRFLKERLTAVADELSLVSDALHDLAEEDVEERLFEFTVRAVVPVEATGYLRATSYQDAEEKFWELVVSDALVYQEECSGGEYSMSDHHIEIRTKDDVQIGEVREEEKEEVDENDFS